MKKAICPQCRTELEIEPIAMISPKSEELTALLKGTLNCFECSQCQHKLFFDGLLRYYNEAAGYLVWYVPYKTGENEADIEAGVKQMLDQQFSALPENERPECRLTFTLPEFIEKIMLHQNGFDDRLVEFIKYQLYQHPKHEVEIDNYQLLYDYSNTDDEKLMFVIFDRSLGKPHAHTHLEMSAYREIAEIYVDTDEGYEELRKIFPGLCVCAGNLYMD